ncbi:hypothetical protein V6N11_077004 [Hibiscus sabdariffa]|uniref:Rx N-terminal domain-containing protein n=1 Tax=Hibiscus sabdariffa TaxID=183260 RepID=A0ABR2TC34_9ROSI
MADVLVSSLVKTIFGTLNSLALREYEIASNLETELQNLESTLTTIQAVLQDAEQKQWKNEAVKNWLRKLKDVAYDADDILDEFAAKAFEMGSSKKHEQQNAVAEEKNKFHLTDNVGDLETDEDREWRLTSSLVNESEIFGRNEDKETVINGLLASLSDPNDDVWNENYEKWECFRNPLKVGAQDSVVMVSTRIEKVALNMATLPIYHLDYLSDNNSWLLFKHHSFLMESKEEYLIELWIANGFVPYRGRRDLHEIGEEIFLELTWRSFFQEVAEDSDGTVTCKMHDLVHDLALSIMRFECYMFGNNESFESPKKIRHLHIPIRSSFLNPHLERIVVDKQYNLVKSCSRLPQSTSCLQKLRIMKIFACRCLRELPQGMKHMISLKCVDISHCDSLERTPPGIGYLTQLLELSIFIVRKEHGCGIEELKELELRKELSLKDLDNVTGSTEAKSANLIRKPKLRSLRLIWGKNAGEHPDNEEEVLGSLQPHSNLEDLRISCYHGLRLPHWWMDLPNLVLVELDQCKRCSHLPPLGELPVLKFLKIRGMDAVKCISNEFYGNGVNPFSSLEKLYFDSMPSLEKWKTVDRGGDFPRLQFLSFRKCPELIELPKFPTLKKLRISTRNNDFVIDNPDLGSLEIHALSSLTFFPSGLLQNHTYLEELTISSLPNLKSLSNKLDHLSMLKHLSIDSCNNVEDIPEAVQNLIALESLFLSECHSLVSFPGNGFHCLPSVRVLTIMSCERFVSLSDAVRHLTHLEELSLVGCPVLNSLPAEIQHLNALQKLEFSWCDGLTTVPNHIEHLTSLSELTFSFCHNLMSLNQSLKSLATLKELTIWGCPHLENRCKKEGGEDWPYIAHIPSIRIMPLDDLPYYGKRRSHGSFLKRFGDWTYGLSRQLLKYKSDS